MQLTTYAINTYFAMLIVTVVGSGATLLIVHVASASEFPVLSGNTAEFAPLQQSILAPLGT